MKNLALVSCRSPFLDDDKVYPPLGLLYLHQAIKEQNDDVVVSVLDNYDTWWGADQIAQADYVGVSIMTPQRHEAERVLELTERSNPKAVTIAGGPHVKHYLDDMLNENWDYLVPRDGIRSINAILNGAEDRVQNDTIGALEYRDQWVKPNRMDNIDFLQGYKYTLQGVNATTMLTAQGCPMPCTFCEDARTMSRWTPLELIQEELDDIKAIGYNGVYLFDDLFAIAMPKVKPISEELFKRDLIYRCNGQANFFTKWGEDFAELLGDTGCVEMAFGHESGSQEILDNVNKRTLVEENYKSVEYAKKHGIHVKSFLMLGLPGETYETMEATEKFIRTSGIDDFQLAIYYPYKGTQIRDAIDRGDSSQDIYFQGEGLGAYGQKGGSTESVVRTSALSSEELINFRDYLVDKYKPQSHKAHFFDTHLYDGDNKGPGENPARD